MLLLAVVFCSLLKFIAEIVDISVYLSFIRCNIVNGDFVYAFCDRKKLCLIKSGSLHWMDETESCLSRDRYRPLDTFECFYAYYLPLEMIAAMEHRFIFVWLLITQIINKPEIEYLWRCSYDRVAVTTQYTGDQITDLKCNFTRACLLTLNFKTRLSVYTNVQVEENKKMYPARW